MKMPPRDRELILRFCDGQTGLPPYAFHIYQHVRHLEIFRWLLAHGYYGKHFLEWIRGQHAGSILKAVAHVVMQVEREKEVRPIIAGRDWAV